MTITFKTIRKKKNSPDYKIVGVGKNGRKWVIADHLTADAHIAMHFFLNTLGVKNE